MGLNEADVKACCGRVKQNLSRIRAIINQRLQSTLSEIPDKSISQLACFQGGEQIRQCVIRFVTNSAQFITIMESDFDSLSDEEMQFIPEYSDELRSLLKRKQNNENVNDEIIEYYFKIYSNRKLRVLAEMCGGYDPTGKQTDMNRSMLLDALYQDIFSNQWSDDPDCILINKYVNQSLSFGAFLSPVVRGVDSALNSEGNLRFADTPFQLRSALELLDHLLGQLNLPENDPLFDLLKKPEEQPKKKTGWFW